MAKSRKEYPKPKSRRSIKRVLKMISDNDKKLKEYAKR